MSPDKLPASFLLAQVGAHAAKAFAQRLEALSLLPSHAGILRMLARHSPLSQRELAARLGMHASRLVAMMDEMEVLGLAKREISAEDRRAHVLRITPAGTETLRQIGGIAREHNRAMTAALSAVESELLTGLLERIAAEQGLIPGVHPGYRTLGEGRSGAGKGSEGQRKNGAD